VAIAVGACAEAPVRLGLVMKAPLGLLDTATSVTLSVFDAGGARCTPDTGRVDNAPTGDAVQTFELAQAGCGQAGAWCKTIELDRDDAEKIFAVTARDASGILAEGCAVEKVDQDPLEVSIKVQRYNPPACCNDGDLQTGEQCDPGVAAPLACDGTAGGQCLGIVADEVCRCDCTAEEILLTVDNVGLPTLTNGSAGSKKQLAMTFAPGIETTKNALRTAYTNTEGQGVGGGDIHVRFLSDDLHKIKTPYPLSQQIRLPAHCTDMDAAGSFLVQRDPSISPMGLDKVAIAYASDQEQTNSFHIWMNVQNDWGCADIDPIKLSMQPGDGQTKPDVAGGPDDAVLVTWSRGTSVFGRIWRKNNELVPPAGELTIATGGSEPRVAGNKDGWVVVYQGSGQGDGDGIFMVTVDPTGAMVSAPELVNDARTNVQDQPDVAMLNDGRSLVVWHSAEGDDILFQHYDAARKRVTEQTLVNTLPGGVQQRPAVAAGLGVFAVAWEEEGGGIFARFIGGTSGFGYNSVTGQNDAFRASTADPPGKLGTRSAPAVAIGGAGYVAIGWQDEDPTHHGLFVRRFPLPVGL
jgi:hypothetical protein